MKMNAVVIIIIILCVLFILFMITSSVTPRVIARQSMTVNANPTNNLITNSPFSTVALLDEFKTNSQTSHLLRTGNFQYLENYAGVDAADKLVARLTEFIEGNNKMLVLPESTTMATKTMAFVGNLRTSKGAIQLIPPINNLASMRPELNFSLATPIVKPDVILKASQNWHATGSDFYFFNAATHLGNGLLIVPKVYTNLILLPPVTGRGVEFGNRFQYNKLRQMPGLINVEGEWLVTDTLSEWYLGTNEQGMLDWLRATGPLRDQPPLNRARFTLPSTQELFYPLFNVQSNVEYLQGRIGTSYHLVDIQGDDAFVMGSDSHKNKPFLFNSPVVTDTVPKLVQLLKEFMNDCENMFDNGNLVNIWENVDWQGIVRCCMMSALSFLRLVFAKLIGNAKALIGAGNSAMECIIATIVTTISEDSACYRSLNHFVTFFMEIFFNSDVALSWRMDIGTDVILTSTMSEVQYIIVTPSSNISPGGSPFIGLMDGDINALGGLHTEERRYMVATSGNGPVQVQTTTSPSTIQNNGSMFLNYDGKGEAQLIAPYKNGTGGVLGHSGTNVMWVNAKSNDRFNFRFRHSTIIKDLARNVVCQISQGQDFGFCEGSPIYDSVIDDISAFVNKIGTDVEMCFNELVERPLDPNGVCTNIQSTLTTECNCDTCSTQGIGCIIHGMLSTVCSESETMPRSSMVCLFCTRAGYSCKPGEICPSADVCDFDKITDGSYYRVHPHHSETRSTRLRINVDWNKTCPNFLQFPRTHLSITLNSETDTANGSDLWYGNDLRSARFTCWVATRDLGSSWVPARPDACALLPSNNTRGGALSPESAGFKDVYRFRTPDGYYLASNLNKEIYFTTDKGLRDCEWVVSRYTSTTLPYIPYDPQIVIPPAQYAYQGFANVTSNLRCLNAKPSRDGVNYNFLAIDKSNVNLVEKASSSEDNIRPTYMKYQSGFNERINKLPTGSDSMGIVCSGVFVDGKNKFWRYISTHNNFAAGNRVKEGDKKETANGNLIQLPTNGPTNNNLAANVILPRGDNTFSIGAFIDRDVSNILMLVQSSTNPDQVEWASAGTRANRLFFPDNFLIFRY